MCVMNQVAMVGFPPIEAREDTLRALGRADLFGTGVNPQQMERMRQLEVRYTVCYKPIAVASFS